VARCYYNILYSFCNRSSNDVMKSPCAVVPRCEGVWGVEVELASCLTFTLDGDERYVLESDFVRRVRKIAKRDY
jgi:hypothetical protein